LWFSVFGGAALYAEIFEGAPLAEAAAADVSMALFALFETLPASTLLSVGATLLVLVFFVTSGDSATFVLGILSEGGNPDPSLRIRFAWGVLVSLIAISLLLVGGLNAIQTAAIVMALPFAIVIALMVVSLLRALREEGAQLDREERVLRRLIRRTKRAEKSREKAV
ncbi:MAG TPA: BCCT family transporter, partial [Zeimonas sp.]|nr:BCCT family transporter [Zeimonas sp.]